MKKRLIYSVLVIAFLIICGVIMTLRTFVYPLKCKEEVLTYSSKYGLDPYLVFAVINTESKFNKQATSSKNAKGLMQITDSTAQEMNEMTNSTDFLDEENIYNENINIELGCKYLASLIQRYNGNYYIAICAYNAGIGNVNKWIDNEIIDTSLDTTQVELPFSETENYLKRVIHYYTMYKKIYKNL